MDRLVQRRDPVALPARQGQPAHRAGGAAEAAQHGAHGARQERVVQDTVRAGELPAHFFRELENRGGFKKASDPRNLGQRHIQAAIDLWRKDGLKPSTIQTYLSFLRGLASWLSKPGFIRPPAYYGLELAEYQRSGINERDKSWSAQGVDVDGLIDKVAAFDPYVGGMLRLIRAFGLRKREAIMFRPNECVVNFADTGLPLADKQGEVYVWIRQGAKGVTGAIASVWQRR